MATRADIEQVFLVWLNQIFLASLQSEWSVCVKYLNIPPLNTIT